MCMSMMVTLIICFICLVAVAILVDIQNNEDVFENIYETEKGWFAIWISLIIFTVNSSLMTIERKLAPYEKKKTLIDMNVSITYKLTLARFFNSTMIPLIVH